MKMKFLAFILLIIIFLVGCGTTTNKDLINQENYKRSAKKVKGNKVTSEAFLFDAKLRQHGKPTSVRLSFFQTDSVIAIAGKGYLGKGALKGWMTDDSILVIFPTMDEYLYESIDNLFSSFNCSGDIPKFQLMSLFSTLPDQFLNANDAHVEIINSDPKRPKYLLKFPYCTWQIEISYDLRKNGYRVKKFLFDDGEGTTLSGNRREYKKSSKIPLKRFQVEITPTMSRIIP